RHRLGDGRPGDRVPHGLHRRVFLGTLRQTASMNEMAGYSALSGGLHDNHRASVTEAPLHLYGRVGRSCAQALAGSFAALITVTGCVTTGGGAGNTQSSGSSSGGPPSLAAVQSAPPSQNAVARDQAIRLQDQQRQQALE